MYANHADAGAIVNTTPVGMYPDNYSVVIDLSRFPRCGFVADMIYNPLKTRLLLDAAALGMTCSGGLPMLAAQAYRAAEIFLDKLLPPSLIVDILKELTASQQNIVLIGMPGSGKSSVAAELAALTGREALDTDAMVERAAGVDIPAIFAAQGEPGFRKLESEAVFAAAKQLGKIISVGGGAVLAPENRLALAQNGAVVFLRRDTNNLSTDGRPLSKDRDTLLRMWEERLPVYEGMADVSIEIAEGDVKGTAERVLSAVSVL